MFYKLQDSFSVKIHDLRYTYNSKLANLTLFDIHEIKGGAVANVRAKILTDLVKCFAILRYSQSKGRNNKEYTLRSDNKYDVCRLKTSSAKFFILRTVFTLVEKSMSIPLKCPFKKVIQCHLCSSYTGKTINLSNL